MIVVEGEPTDMRMRHHKRHTHDTQTHIIILHDDSALADINIRRKHHSSPFTLEVEGNISDSTSISPRQG